MEEVTIRTHPITESEKIQFGTFISHSSADTDLKNELEVAIREAGLDTDLFSENFIVGGDDFHEKIIKCIHCNAGVIILSENSLRSNWVGYECGYFDGLGLPVAIWDKYNLLSFEKLDENFLNVYLLNHTPTYRTADEIANWMKMQTVYPNMFNFETDDFTKEQFYQMINEKVETVIVHIQNDIFRKKKDLLSKCSLGTLIINFGMFYDGQTKGESCKCSSKINLTNSKCIYNDIDNPYPCALINTSNKEKLKECMILNHILMNGRCYNAVYKSFDGTEEEIPTLSFYVPVHKHYGTEFKFIIDAPNAEIQKEVFSLCEELGLNPTVSDTLNNLRIYLSLDPSTKNGLFRLNDDHYYNNFLCPHSTHNSRK